MKFKKPYIIAEIGSNFNQNLETGYNLIKQAKKYETKGKAEKAKKRYKKAQKYLLKSNKEIPNKPDTLNYLGFTTRKLGDFEGGEKFYLEGLAINLSYLQLIFYFISFVSVIFFVFKSLKQSLQKDSEILTKITAYIVRSSFWAVLIVGVADFLISFMVVEKLVEPIFGEQLKKKFQNTYYEIWLMRFLSLLMLGSLILLFYK